MKPTVNICDKPTVDICDETNCMYNVCYRILTDPGLQ